MPSTTTSTDLIVPGSDSSYSLLTMSTDDVTDLISSNLSEGESIRVGDLPRIKTPSGGQLNWEIPDLDGATASKELRGVIIQVGTNRAYYHDEYSGATGADARPDCSSDGGLIGIPNPDSENPGPGGQCSACPFNEFGTGKKGVGKACTESRQLFVLAPDKLLPFVLNVKPGSLAMFKAYRFGLLNAGLKPGDIETVMTLSKQKGANAEFSRIEFRTGQRLGPEAKAHIAAYTELIRPHLVATAIDLQREDSAEAA